LVQHEIIKLVAHPKNNISWLGMRTRAFMGLGLLFPKRFLILKKPILMQKFINGKKLSFHKEHCDSGKYFYKAEQRAI